MARPKAPEPEKLTAIRLPLTLFEGLSALARIDDRPVSWEFRSAVKLYLKSRAKELKTVVDEVVIDKFMPLMIPTEKAAKSRRPSRKLDEE
jgi:hypothetical protein